MPIIYNLGSVVSQSYPNISSFLLLLLSSTIIPVIAINTTPPYPFLSFL